jgi:hypothetical protein
VNTVPSNSNLITLKATPNQSLPRIAPATTTTTSLKRPFIMMAVFFVFGLNILQFITLNQTPIPSSNQIQGLLNDDTQLAAALASAQARDNALLDASIFQRGIVKARHLLSNFDDYDDSTEGNDKQKRVDKTLNGATNLTKRGNDSMELVLINGTWHLINLSMCYNMMNQGAGQFYNYTHVARINNELNGWVERHQNRFGRDQSKAANSNGKYASSALLRNLNRNQRLSLGGGDNSGLNLHSFKDIQKKTTDNSANKKVYPVSLYDNQQNKRNENFAKMIRKRNDTFYFISFRRDYTILPALAQNKTQRPRISLLIPTLLSSSNGNDSNSSRQQQPAGVAFMRIECEVTDTSLFHLKLNDIPLDYMKIIHQDFVMNPPGAEF